MGHTLHGQIYLYPEEALYLVDRGSLLVDHQGVNMSVQQMWTTYLTCNHKQKTPALAMERYLAYAYLKRLGFIVIRPGTYDPEGGPNQILQKLQIIPSARLIHTSHRRVQRVNEDKKSAIDFEVYKPAGSFKKRQPGTPDYHVVVVESTAMLPSLGELSDMMDGQQDPAQDVTSSINQGVAGSDKGKARKVEQWPQILFAVVSGGQVSFMSMFNTKAVL
ncbi:tRNA-splicing endonuclease subunit sen54 [Mortierella sp. NVP85]|nr:tRNA-splicing endonuclease subunit sen54 [Mortierella sp. NVP85]